jgi:prepilin-type N-terminal cleavage/methylation domain-containing protein
MNRNPLSRWPRGFTLIELLVVIAIIAIVLTRAFSRGTSEQNPVCRSRSPGG